MTLFHISNHRERIPFRELLAERVPGIVFLSLDDISQRTFGAEDRLIFHFRRGRRWSDLPVLPREQLSPTCRLHILYLFPRSFDPKSLPVNLFLYADEWLKMPISPDTLITWYQFGKPVSQEAVAIPELYQSIFDDASDGILLTDQRGIIQKSNAAFSLITGLSGESVLGKHAVSLANELLPSDYTPGFLKQVANAALSHEKQLFRFPYRDKVLELTFPESGSKLYPIVLIRDISQQQQTQDELRAAKNYYETVFQTSGLAMLIFNENMHIQKANQECENISQYSAEELTGRAWTDFIYEADLPILTEPWQKRDEALLNETNSYQVRILRKDGKVRRTVMNVRRIPHSTHWVVAIEDITEPWEKSFQLKQSETFSRQIFDAVNDAMFIYPVDESGLPGSFFDVNQAACEIFGYSREEFKYKGLEDIDPRYNAERFKKFALQVLKEGNAILESNHRIQNGKIIPVEISTRFFINDGITLFISSARDIRERKKNEKILQEERDLFQSLIDNLPDSVFFKDRSHRFIRVNRAKADSHHESPEALIGRSDAELFPLDVAENSLRDDQYVLESGVPVLNREERLVYDDGSVHWVIVTKLPRRNNQGEIVGTMGIARDITQHREAELALKESERRISLLMSNLPGMVYRCLQDEFWTMTFVNDGVKALTGYEAEDLINNRVITYEEIIHPDDRPRVRIVINQAIHRGIPFELTYRIITRDGKERWVRERGRHAEMQESGYEIIDGFITDITQQKLADDRLRESEARFRQIFMTSPDPASISRMEDSRFVDVNTGMLELFGYSRHEFIGHTASELGLWQSNDDREKMLQQLETEGRILNLEVRLRNHEGEILIALMSANIIQLHGEQHAITIIRDITALKLAEEALRQSEARYHSLYQSMSEIFMLCELVYEGNEPVDYRILDVNEAFVRHFEISREQAVDHTRSELFGPTSGEILKKYVQLVQTGASIQYEYYFQNLSRWYNVSGFTPEPGRFALLMSDITEKKRIGEELQRAQKLESIGLLAGGIAHDFNNRLAAILGNAQLAQLYVQKESQINSYLNTIVKGAQQATHLTKQLLTFSRGGNPVKKVHKVEKLIRDAIEISLSGSKQRCHTDIPADLWNTKVDGGQIIQIFNNIIINASQAMPDGGQISIKAKNFNQTRDGETLNLGEAKYVRVEIRDSGEGIPESIIGKIFDPFFTTKKSGTGLGLATCYSIIKKHGGDIRVESQPGKGSVFYVYLPAAEEDLSLESDSDQLSKGSGRVLIMDDDEMIVNMLTLLLKSLGYSAEGALHGEAAIQLCQKHLNSESAFQIAILDLTVSGGMGGEEAVSHLKKLDSKLKVLVSSGYSTDPIMSNFRKYGFDGVIPKPYTKESLSRALTKVFEN